MSILVTHSRITLIGLENHYQEPVIRLSLHQEMDKVFRRSNYWVKDPLSPILGDKMLAGVLHMRGYTATQMGLVAGIGLLEK